MGIRAERILLYGSQAAGTAREYSDIDLFVISEDWSKYSHSARILEPIQAQGITPGEITSRQIPAFGQHILMERAVVA